MKQIWNYETTYKEAHRYTSRNEFRKGSSSAYQVALKNGWLDDYTWFERPEAYNKKWTYDTCYEEAQKYSSRNEFSKGSRGAYDVARKNGWLDDYYWLQDNRIDTVNGKIDSVYVYEFKEQNCAYVGRTVKWRQKRRHQDHIDDIENDAVAKFAYENNIAVPEPIYLAENLTLAEGVRLEEYWENKYREDGWTMLNRAKTGSIGALGAGKWTRKACYREAHRYTSRNEFRKGSSSAYQVALKNGWLDDYTWFEENKKPKGYWEVYENNKAKAIEYSSRNEFKKGSSRAYYVALEKGWLDGYTWFEENKKPSGYWQIYENNKAEAQKYSSRSEFKKGSSRAYTVARQNGWLREFFPRNS